MTDTAQQILGKHSEDLIANTAMASDTLSWLGELFRCIKEAAETGKAMSTTRISNLAAIGDYLAEDFANLFAGEREAMQIALDASKSQGVRK